jgi:hypothetical protein
MVTVTGELLVFSTVIGTPPESPENVMRPLESTVTG